MPAQTIASVVMGRRALPILHECDVVVVDGSLGGVAAALALARAAARPPWSNPAPTWAGRSRLPCGPGSRCPRAGPALPALVAELIAASWMAPAAGEVALRMDAVKVRLEDLLLAAGVKILYASRPVALWREQGVLRGVVIGNKSAGRSWRAGRW